MGETVISAAISNRREQILSGACKIFAEYGYDASTTKLLAAEIGCSEALIYKYFKTKQDIIETLFEEWQDTILLPVHFEIINNSAVSTLKLIYTEYLDNTWNKDYRPDILKVFFSNNQYRQRCIKVLTVRFYNAQKALVPVIEFGQKINEIKAGEAASMAAVFITFSVGFKPYTEYSEDGFSMPFEELEKVIFNEVKK